MGGALWTGGRWRGRGERGRHTRGECAHEGEGVKWVGCRPWHEGGGGVGGEGRGVQLLLSRLARRAGTAREWAVDHEGGGVAEGAGAHAEPCLLGASCTEIGGGGAQTGGQGGDPSAAVNQQARARRRECNRSCVPIRAACSRGSVFTWPQRLTGATKGGVAQSPTEAHTGRAMARGLNTRSNSPGHR